MKEEKKQVEECGCVNYGGNGLFPKYCPTHLKEKYPEKDNIKEEILKEFREKKELAYKKLQALAVVNGSVIDAEIITEEWLSQSIDKALSVRDEEWREKITEIGMLRQLFAEMKDDKTFTAKELADLFEKIVPLLSREMRDDLINSMK